MGSYVPAVFRDSELVLADSELVDVGDAEAVRDAVLRARPDVILHLAAATDVDRCELDPDWAFRTNAAGTENVARACREIGALMVYVSTAAVFDGSKSEPYTELDAPSPANVYGRTKLAGEEAVATMLDRFYIVRAGWMVGGGARDKKFVGKVVSLIESGETHLKAVDDKRGSPVFSRDFLEGVKGLLATGAFGIYHLASPPPATRYEIAVAIRDALGRDDVVVEPVSSDEFPLPAPRGASEALQSLRLGQLGLEELRPWRDALAEYLADELLPALGTKRP